MATKTNYTPYTLLHKKFPANVKGYDPEKVDETLDEIILDYKAFEKYYTESRSYIAKLEEDVIKLREDYIKLGQALKAAGFVENGVDAKIEIQEGNVLVNGEVDTRRGKKLVDGDIVSFNGQEVKIVK